MDEATSWTEEATMAETAGFQNAEVHSRTGTTSATQTWMTPSSGNPTLYNHAGIMLIIKANSAGGLSITPTGASVSVTPGTATVAAGAVTVSPTGASVSVTPGTATVAASAVTVSPTGATVTVTPGTVTVTAGTASVTPTGATVSVTAGTVTVTQGLQLAPTGATVTVTPGTATVAAGAVTILPTGPTVTVTPGTATVAVDTTTITATGATVTVTAGSVGVYEKRYPASISGTKILDQNGDVYLIKPFSSWALYRLTRTQITQAIEDVAEHGGFNGIVVWFGGGYDNNAWSNPYQNGDGEDIWSGTEWASDFGTGWDTYDHIVDECNRVGLDCHISLAVAFGNTGAQAEMEAASDAQMKQVGEDIANRYAAYDNIVWHVMFDDANGTGTTIGSRIESYFEGINDTEGASARPVRWVENGNGQSTVESGWFEFGESQFTVNTEYGYVDESVELIDDARADTGAGTKPIGDCEPPYVGSSHYSGNQWQQHRERTFAVFLRDGCLAMFGHGDWWIGPEAVFSGQTEGYDWDEVFAQSTPVAQQADILGWMDTYVADATWDDSGWVSAGVETGDLKAAAGNSDTAALAYFPDSRTGIEVDTTVLAGGGPVALRWLDPTTGATHTTITSSEAQQTGRSVTYPTVSGRTSTDSGTTDLLLLAELVGQPITPTGASVSVTPGTATVVLGDSLAPIAPTVTVTPGTVSVTTGAVAISPTGATVTVTAGTVSVAPSQPLALTGPTVTVTPGTVTVAVGAAVLALTAAAVSVTAGAVTVVGGGQVVYTGPATLSRWDTPRTVSNPSRRTVAVPPAN